MVHGITDRRNMIFPDNFEHKIGFDEIRTQLKGRCMSTLGTEWVDNRLRFSTDYAEIVRNLSEARDFARFTDEQEDIYEENFFDVRQPLLRIRPERTYLEELELFDLKRSLTSVCDLVNFFQQTNEDNEPKYPALTQMVSDVKTFPAFIKRVDAVLNKYGKVKDTASSDLLQIRHNIEVTTRGISHSLRTIISEAQKEGYIDRDVTPTLRDGRLVIPVAPALKRKIKGIIHDESATGKTVFIEPAAVVDANNKIRELKSAEKREIVRILIELTNEVRPFATDMLQSLHFLAHIDYLRALTNFSETFEAIVPELKNYPAIDWVQAIHPLLQQSLHRHNSKQVPLDISLRGKQRILLISGPNAGGKSVCLKTVGLLQYMVQCGMPVPMSENSTVGIFEDIFISIGDEQDLQNELSTYSSHLLGLKMMMRRGGPKSLLLVDEFGGGTEPQIGGAMAEAIMNRFVQNEVYGVITTHYQNLKRFAESSPTVVNAAMLYDRAQMKPLFLLRIGHPGSSFAIEIAKKIGIPSDVIEYAEDLVGRDYVMSDKYLQDIARDKMYWENKRQKVHTQEKQLEASLNNYERELEQFREERKRVMDRAKAEAETLLKESNAKIENTIRAIKEAQAEKERTQKLRQELNEYKDQILHDSADEEQIKRKLEKVKRRQQRKNDKRSEANKVAAVQGAATAVHSHAGAKPHKTVDFEVGDYVRLQGQNSVGQIQELSAKQARVLFGVMTTNVALARLEKASKPVQNNLSVTSTFISKQTREAVYNRKLQFRPEIDLRGLRGDDALDEIAHFIDDAILLEQKRVRILHGTGTGALRDLVRKYLQTVPGVKSFSDEHVQMGGAGITVVDLR